MKVIAQSTVERSCGFGGRVDRAFAVFFDIDDFICSKFSRQQAEHYESEAARFTRMAEAEPMRGDTGRTSDSSANTRILLTVSRSELRLPGLSQQLIFYKD